MKLPFFTKPIPKKFRTSTTSIIFDGEEIAYTLKLYSRTRYLRITIHRDGNIGVSAPLRTSSSFVEKCLHEKKVWILSKREYYHNLPQATAPSETKKEYEKHKDGALTFVKKKVEVINSHYNFTYNEVHIKNQKTLWGSCSRRGNLNFNYKLVLIRDELASYIVAHELCHLKEFNHGKAFWNLVAETIPNHKEIRKELKSIARIS